MRSYRGPNSHNRQERAGRDTAFLGATAARVAEGRPEAIEGEVEGGLVGHADRPDGGRRQGRRGSRRFEAVANGDGPALGREHEIAELFRNQYEQKIRNVVWITADVHYAAAHYYDPAKAQFTDFDPFWEFVAGPMHAGGFGPGKLDNTFGPRAEFVKSPGGRVNVPPTEGGQYYGLAKIDGKSGALKVQIKDLERRDALRENAHLTRDRPAQVGVQPKGGRYWRRPSRKHRPAKQVRGCPFAFNSPTQ